MNLTPAESRLLRKLFEEMKDFNRNRLVVMSKLPPARIVEKDGKQFTERHISPEWVEAMKLKLPAEARELSILGYVRLHVDATNTLKHGKIDFVAEMSQDGFNAFLSNLRERAHKLSA